MAIGDYVRTSAGAFAKGARAIVAQALSTGRSGSEAAAALSSAFPRLSGQIAGGIVRGTQQQLAAGQTQFQGGLAFGAPALSVVGTGNIPTQQTVLVRVVVELADGSAIETHHNVRQQAGDSIESARAAAQSMAMKVFASGDYPELQEEAEEGGAQVDVNAYVESVSVLTEEI
jgi:hypothetical protein